MNDTESRLSAALADRYRIEREIGAGGTATAYLAPSLPGSARYLFRLMMMRDARLFPSRPARATTPS
jgi:serine/threonine-protein kinase